MWGRASACRTTTGEIRIASLNPFRGLPNPREVWAWAMYDLANQSFTLLIVTLFFSIYFQNTIATTPEQGKQAWGLAVGASSLVVVVLGPVLGALADFGGRKKAWLVALGLACSLMTMVLAAFGPGDLLPAAIVFVLANIAFMGGENFLASFLPEIAKREHLSRVSAIGWTFGYLGAMLVLPIAGVVLAVMGVNDAAMRTLFFAAGLWFLLNLLPALLFLKERKTPEALPPGRSLWSVGFVRLWETAREARRFGSLMRFLVAMTVYSAGMSIIIAFAGDLAFQYLGAGPIFIVYCWVLSLVAGVGSISTGWFQVRFGHRRTICVSLVLWLCTSAGAAMLPPPGGGPLWPIWLIGLGIGLGLGMTGNAGRTLVGAFTPRHKTAEFFGLWGLSYKLASVVGPPLYGLVFASAGQGPALWMVAGFFLVGLVLMGLVDVRAGERATLESEAEFGRIQAGQAQQ